MRNLKTRERRAMDSLTDASDYRSVPTRVVDRWSDRQCRRRKNGMTVAGKSTHHVAAFCFFCITNNLKRNCQIGVFAKKRREFIRLNAMSSARL